MQVTIPSKETSYWCRIVKLDQENTKKHIFMVSCQFSRVEAKAIKLYVSHSRSVSEASLTIKPWLTNAG